MRTAQQYETEHLACPLQTDLVNSMRICVPLIQNLFGWFTQIGFPLPKNIILCLLIQPIRACKRNAAQQPALNCQMSAGFVQKEHTVSPSEEEFISCRPLKTENLLNYFKTKSPALYKPNTPRVKLNGIINSGNNY